MSTTEEIEKAVKGLKETTLKAALEHFKLPTYGNFDKLVKRYQKQVLHVGTKNFVNRLKDADAKASVKALNLKSEGNPKEVLKEHLADEGINGLIEKVEESLLKKYAQTMGLDPTEKRDMIQQIADEVMLTGMESFLCELPLDNLKAHCAELSLDVSGTKKELVERLMIYIFELEPLDKESENILFTPQTNNDNKFLTLETLKNQVFSRSLALQKAKEEDVEKWMNILESNFLTDQETLKMCSNETWKHVIEEGLPPILRDALWQWASFSSNQEDEEEEESDYVPESSDKDDDEEEEKDEEKEDDEKLEEESEDCQILEVKETDRKNKRGRDDFSDEEK